MAQQRQKSGEPRIIIAYGFDAIGFQIPSQQVPLGDEHLVEFLPMKDPKRLDSAEGVIIPQGIFEEIEYDTNFWDERSAKVTVERPLLLERLKQILNLYQEGGWICFLVRTIIDDVPAGGYSRRDIVDTDLCKRILNSLELDKSRRSKVDGLPQVRAKYDEFRQYARDYGIANTIFKRPYQSSLEIRTLAEANDLIVAFEADRAFFFLPFHTIKKDAETAIKVSKLVALGIIDYRQKHILDVPAWADEFQFDTEKKLALAAGSLMEQANKAAVEMQSWREYKVILNSSGEILKDSVVRLLRGFFQLNVSSIEEYIEDAKIVDEKGAPLAFIETKGTKAGIQRGFISQVDAHRDRHELSASVPGLLIVNNEMSVNTIDKRLQTTVAAEQIKHARNLNVLIIRTIDLLFLMKQLEGFVDKKKILLDLMKSGGGWLKATRDDHRVVQE